MTSVTHFGTMGEMLNLPENVQGVFFRNDDVWDADSKLCRLIDLFISYGMPLNLEVIPGLLTDDGVNILRRYKKSHPAIIELHQHGWMHVNNEPQGRKCEFGMSRSYDQQFDDIASGKQKMIDAFGDDFYPAFTPPWNRCSEHTYKVLNALNFKILSKLKSDQVVTEYKFHEVSVTLDIYLWKNGSVMREPEEIMSEFNKQLIENNIIGIMLHHQVMDDTAFEFLEYLLANRNAAKMEK